jgi:hypothetical protein
MEHYIMTFSDKIKQGIWYIIYRVFPNLQKTLLELGVLHQDEPRQRYHLGWLTEGKSLEEVKKYLHENWNFGNNFIAWVDDGQVLSWRKLVSFREQYHLRIFCDGEIRGHFEFTPEAHPFRHFKEIGEEDRTEDFLKFLGDFVVQGRHLSNLNMNPEAFKRNSQHTIYKAKKLKPLHN